MLPLLLAVSAHAGLGPDDVVVLYNADDPAAAETAAYYGAARELDDDRLCGISGIDPAARTIAFADAEAQILKPLEACLDALRHPEDVDAIVLVRGLPYRVNLLSGQVSLEAMLQVGRATERTGGALLIGRRSTQGAINNPMYVTGGFYPQDMTASFGASIWYATSPRLARGEAVPGPFVRSVERVGPFFDWTDNLFIVSRLDGFDHDDARALVDRAIAADESFPEAPFLCMRGAEGARGVRDGECEHALRMLDAAGFATEWVPAYDAALSGKEVVAYWTGTANLKQGIDGNTYVPGAVAENITSFGAVPNNFFCDESGETCPASESQTSIARLVRAGVTGTHGTVAEPYNNVFPNAGFLLLYAHGYTMGEAFLANQRFLYWVNLYLGDPLTVPFAERPVVSVDAASPHPVNLPVPVLAEHAWGTRPPTVYLDGGKVEVLDDGEGPVFALDGYVAGDVVDVFVVVEAAAPEPVAYDGWPAFDPVAFDPGPKGWLRTTLTVGEPWEDPDTDVDDEGGCAGCASGDGGGSALGLGALVLAALRRRRRSDR